MTSMTLANRLWPQGLTQPWARALVLAVAGSLLVAGAAQVTLPMWPVPMTLQTCAVLAVGAAYGARLGAVTLGLYALEGAIGLPFFAGGKGGIFDDKLDYFLPASSMGYVVGFIFSAWLVGKMVEDGWADTIATTIAATIAGAMALYVPGLIWLAIWASVSLGMDSATAMSSAVSWGLFPFVIGDVLKAVIAGLAVPAAGALLAPKS